MQNIQTDLVSPYGGTLVDLLVDRAEEETRTELILRSHTLPKIQLSSRNMCDYELLATGAFSPVETFLGQKDYESVLENMRLSNGAIFPIPVTLSIDSFEGLKLDGECVLADQYNNPLATMRIEEIYEWDAQREAQLVCGTTDLRHPLVAEMQTWGRYNISGKITAFDLPKYYDFKKFRLSPSEVREKLHAVGKTNIVAFQTRNPLHRAHEEMTKRAIESVDGALLLHPVVGLTQPGDIDYFTRVRSYKKLIEKYYSQHSVVFALLPLAMRMAGPREALWHAIIRRNYGANHLIVGRYHATPAAVDNNGNSFYGAYDAQEMLLKYENETGIKPILFSDYVYLPDDDRYEEITKISEETRHIQLSGTDVRRKLEIGESIPEWQMRPEIIEILKENCPPLHQQGFCVWFTGLSGSGKSTIANILITKLLEHGRRTTLLDGDIVRTNLSKGLGFSKEDRDTNIRRIGFVASEIVKHDGAVVCAAVSPYCATRNECRAMMENFSFIEVFVNTPLDVCEQRDTKGLYSLAKAGKLENFTGINDPYEEPVNPEIIVETTQKSPEANAEIIMAYLIKNGLILE